MARFNLPAGMAIDPAEPDVLYVADSGNHQIVRVQISTSTTTYYAGSWSHGWDYKDGEGLEARFAMPNDIAIHTVHKCDGTQDRQMFVADMGNHRIRAINMDTMMVT